MSSKTTDNVDDMCPLCSENITIFAVGECDHIVCYKCSTRMRVLCEQMYCAICRTDLPKVKFTKKAHKFASIGTHHAQLYKKSKIYFESPEIQSMFFRLLDHKCKICTKRMPFQTFAGYKDHMRKEHELFPCDLCVEHIRLFTSERKFYDRKRLAEHRRIGDADDKSHKGHPLCEFCDVRYLDKDELFRHLRKDHYYCHFCDADGISWEFYSEYLDLKDHFRNHHYLCEDGPCINAEFTNAFRSDIDLKAHRATMHSKNMTKALAKAARTLEIDFSYGSDRGQHQRRRGDRHDRHDRNRQGVVTSEDYSMDNMVDVGGGGARGGRYNRGGRGRGRGRGGRRDDDEQLQRAINASIDDQNKTSKNQRTRQESFKEETQDFPTLDGKVTSTETTTTNTESKGSRKKKKNSSMANQVAMANNFSVSGGNIGDDAFPALGGFGAKCLSDNSKEIKAKPSNMPTRPNWNMKDSDDDEDVEDHLRAFGGGGGRGVEPEKLPQKEPPPSKPEPPIVKVEPEKVIPKSVPKSENKQKQSHQQQKSSWNKAATVKSSDDFPSLGTAANPSAFSMSSSHSKWAQPRKSAPVKPSAPAKPSKPAPVGVKPSKPAPVGANWADSSSSLGKTPSVSSTNDFPSLSSIGRSLFAPPTARPSAVTPPKQSVKAKPRPEPIFNKGGKKSAPRPRDSSEEREKAHVLLPSDMPVDREAIQKAQVFQAKSNVSIVKPKDNTHFVSNQSSNFSSNDFPSLGGSSKKNFPGFGSAKKDFPSLGGSKKPAPAPQWAAKEKAEKKQAEKPKKEEKDSGIMKMEVKKKKKKSKAKKQWDEEEDVIEFPDDTPFDYSIPDAPAKNDSNGYSEIAKEQAAVQELINECESEPVPTILKSGKGTKSSKKNKSTCNAKAESGMSKEEIMKNYKVDPDTVSPINLESDFPTLGSGPPKAPPPGFKSGPTKTAPPGFNKSTSKAPPPGFANVTSNTQEVTKAVDNLDINSNGKIENPAAPAVYIRPPNFPQRNQSLITDIQTALGNSNASFDKFKQYSIEFRQGILSGEDYFQKCSTLLGANYFNSLFSELLVLLPDIDKQQELYKAHCSLKQQSTGKKGKKKGWSSADAFTSCTVCKQVVLNIDIKEHQVEHSEEGDFPTLGMAANPAMFRMASLIK